MFTEFEVAGNCPKKLKDSDYHICARRIFRMGFMGFISYEKVGDVPRPGRRLAQGMNQGFWSHLQCS